MRLPYELTFRRLLRVDAFMVESEQILIPGCNEIRE